MDGRDAGRAVPPGVTAAKAELRRRARLRRAAPVDPVDPGRTEALARTATAAEPLGRLLREGSGNVLAYAAVRGEPDLAALRESLRAGGIRVLLPVVTGPGLLRWGVDTGTLRSGRALPSGLRVDEPTGPLLPDLVAADLGPDDVVLVPALGVSLDGTRLGQGGGFYDRALAALPRWPSGPLVVGVVHDDELLPPGTVPAEAHDLRVDAALTPSAWVVIAP